MAALTALPSFLCPNVANLKKTNKIQTFFICEDTLHNRKIPLYRQIQKRLKLWVYLISYFSAVS